MKTLTKYSFFFALAGFVAILAYFLSGLVRTSPNIIESFYVTDFTDDKKLAGAMHDIIVGKLISEKETILIGGLPATVFRVDIVDNIKGSLSGSIDMVEEGGCMNGECFISEGDVIISSDLSGSDKVDSKKIKYNKLKAGETYIFSLRSMEDGRYMLNSHPSGKSTIGSEAEKNNPRTNKRYKELRRAYVEEELLEMDIKNGNDKNSFKKLPKELQDNIINEVKN